MFGLRAIKSANIVMRNAISSKSGMSSGWRSFAAKSSIIYTETDEAPALATYALLPIIQKFVSRAGIDVELCDISLAGRIVSQFPERLKPEQRVDDNLAKLGELTKSPDCNIIKLPNISASVPQLEAAIAELRAKGYDLPPYPANPATEEEKEINAKYAKVLGSAVNPVLREGNSDRRVAKAVKEYARKNPHRMGKWTKDCKTHVAHMSSGDFYGSEKSAIMPSATDVRIEHVAADGSITVLKKSTALKAGEIIDASFLSVAALRSFLEKEYEDCKKQNLLFSVHLKATMMKVSDPIMFGHVVTTYYKAALDKHAATLTKLKFNPNNGIGDLYDKIKKLPADEKAAIERDLQAVYADRPALAMVNSDKGITNLHVPSDVIVDASMPCVVRDSGCMWNKENKLAQTKCVIPDRCYATVYQACLDDVREHGQFDVKTMGSVANVGLMAQKAEEYGSHDKTFKIAKAGTVRVVDATTNKSVFEHSVGAGDIWRMCQTKDIPIQDWVKLAVNRARLSKTPAIFWLDSARAHDASVISKVNTYLKKYDTTGLDISIQTPVNAIKTSMQRARAGKDTISVTGNVLRDYLTDLFPIIELGTSAKMLSIVPLLNGGGMFETGAGGSAPKHVQQFQKEGHLRWDSLGEYLALGVSLEHLGETQKNAKALELANGLDVAIGKFLDDKRSPSAVVHEQDNRSSSFYLGLYWAEAMSAIDPAYKPLAAALSAGQKQIAEDLIKCQGSKVDTGGYYKFDDAKTTAAMNPSATLNKILAEVKVPGVESKL